LNIAPDIEEARRFLSMIAPDGNAVFQTFDDDEGRKENEPDVSAKLARTTRSFDALKGYNEKRAGVFVTINEVEGDRRKADKVTRVRSLFADFDGVELPDVWDVEPSLIVNTSPAKFHVYWLCSDTFPKEEFSDAQHAIAAHFGTDPVVCDLPRVMRLPGFWHRKNDAYQVRIIEGDGRKYATDVLRDWISRITPEKPPELPPVRRSSLNGSVSPYVKAGVERALASIASAGKGNRNTTLNSEAFGIFGLVKAGFVPETIKVDIEQVALSIGLTKAEVNATLKSAWSSSKPRVIPERIAHRYESTARHDPETGEVFEDAPEGDKPEWEKKEAKKEKPINVAFGDMPFRMLGHNRGSYFYLPRAGGQIVALKSHEHTPLRLLAIATLNDWYTARGDADGRITEYQWQQLANGLIHSQHAEGIFEETRLRGRGAWMDGKRVIVHTGSEVIVDHVPTDLTKVNSRYVYEAAPSWDFGFSEPATSSEAHRLVEICDRLTWEDSLSGALLAGWCVIAPVSGALPWRPHVWINGPAGSGKTTAQVDIVGRVVGPSALRLEGKTTEASIRQNMGFDARPVLLDEAEGEDTDGAKRMQGILDLARVSSSGGVISKGSSQHRAVNFVVRSCFCFSSIHSSIRHHADESRITRLSLRKNDAADSEQHFVDLTNDIAMWFTPEYASRMFARTVKYLPILLKNSQIFTSAASIALKNRRAADQVGPMLAGLYLCHSSGAVTLDAATAFIQKHQWNDHLSLDSQSDEYRLFSYIMTRMVRVMTNDGPREMTVGQAFIDGGYARELGPMGIKADAEGNILIANKSDRLHDLLREKPQWQSDWKRVLSLLPGATKPKDPEYFAPAVLQRMVKIPRGLLR
jgi:hypothetical protein